MNTVISHLSGRQFSSSLRVHLAQLSAVGAKGFRVGLSRRGGRNSAILKLMSESDRVLHIGCVDHPPLIEEKISAGTYLHKLLVDFVGEESAFGFDINEQGLEYMRRKGFRNLTSNYAQISKERFDVVLIPDTLEHLQNTGQFLEALESVNFKRLVITVPNAYALQNRFFFLSESINSDHRTLHSPYSLSRLLYDCGFEVKKLVMADYWGLRRPVRSLIKYFFPLTREHLIVEAKRKNRPASNAQKVK